MKLQSVFLTLSLVATLNAGQSTLEKYTELRNNSNNFKTESHRNMMIKNRKNTRDLRDFRDTVRDLRRESLYAKVERTQTHYR